MRLLLIISLIIVLAIIFVPEEKMINFLEKLESFIKDFFKKIFSYIYNFISSIVKNIFNEINRFILDKVEKEKIKIMDDTWNFIRRILFIPETEKVIEIEEEIIEEKEVKEGE